MDLAAIITAISGGITGIVAAWIKVINPLRKEAKRKKADLYRMIKSVHDEVKFNGGSSIKDAIFELKETTKRINYRLGEIEENQKIAMNLQGVAFWNSDTDGECVYASPALCKIIGRSESEILGTNWAAWLVYEDKKRVYDAWLFSVKTGSAFDEVYSFEKPDGSVVKVWGLAFHKRIDGEHLGTLGKLAQID